MSDAGADDGAPLRPLPPHQRRLFAFAMIAGGLRWIDIAPAPGVPQWMIGIVGALFALAGVAVGLGPRPTRALDVVAALIVTGFAAVGGWVAFGPGDRVFTATMSGAAGVGGGMAGAAIGRIAFGAGALLCGVFAGFLWQRALRRPPDSGPH